jgi:hypothetical protein
VKREGIAYSASAAATIGMKISARPSGLDNTRQRPVRVRD